MLMWLLKLLCNSGEGEGGHTLGCNISVGKCAFHSLELVSKLYVIPH